MAGLTLSLVEAFNNAKQNAGGFENVGALKNGFIKIINEIKICLLDTQMVIDRFTNKKQNSSEFFLRMLHERLHIDEINILSLSYCSQ